MIAGAVMVASAAIAFTGLNYVSAMKANQKNQAIDACYQASQDTWESKWQEQNDGQNKDLSNSIRKPVKEVFEQCMKEKGLK